MKYLYPYECSTLKLSSPTELQCAIDGNRRDTSRRPSIGHYTSMVEPEVGFYSDSASPKSTNSSPALKRPPSPSMGQSNMTLRLPSDAEVREPVLNVIIYEENKYNSGLHEHVNCHMFQRFDIQKLVS